MTALSGSQSAAAAPGPDGTARRPFAVPGLVRLWLAPIAGPLATVENTASTPLAELTMTDVVAWAAVVGYAALSGMVAARLAGGLAAVALRPPRYR